MTPEQALETGVYIIVLVRNLAVSCLARLIIVNLQARYFGLCSVMCVDTRWDTYQLIPDWFTRLSVICVFKSCNSEFAQPADSAKRKWGVRSYLTPQR